MFVILKYHVASYIDEHGLIIFLLYTKRVINVAKGNTLFNRVFVSTSS